MYDCISFVHDELRRRGLIASWTAPEAVWRTVLVPCKSCSGSVPTSHKKCRGWRLAFRDHQALVLAPATINKRETQLVIEAQFDAQRPDGPWEKWPLNPIRGCNATFILRDPLANTVLTRQHLDLANAGQDGTTWHVQLGGVGSDADKAWLKAVAALRWPSSPTDFILLIELALYLFHFSVWKDLQASAPWCKFIADSEDLVLPHYFEALNGYWNQRSSAPSWLAAQCNKTGSIDPR